MNIQEATSPAVKPKQSALEKYNIDDKDTPWANVKEQALDFEDYKARIKSNHDKEKETARTEQMRLGDLVKEKDEIEHIETATE